MKSALLKAVLSTLFMGICLCEANNIGNNLLGKLWRCYSRTRHHWYMTQAKLSDDLCYELRGPITVTATAATSQQAQPKPQLQQSHQQSAPQSLTDNRQQSDNSNNPTVSRPLRLDDTNHATYVEPPLDFKPVIYEQLPSLNKPSALNLDDGIAVDPPFALPSDNDDDSYDTAMSQNSIANSQSTVSDNKDSSSNNNNDDKQRPSRWSDWTDMSVEPELVASEPQVVRSAQSGVSVINPRNEHRVISDDDPLMTADSSQVPFNSNSNNNNDNNNRFDADDDVYTGYSGGGGSGISSTDDYYDSIENNNSHEYDNTILADTIPNNVNVWSLKPAGNNYFVPPAIVRMRKPTTATTTTTTTTSTTTPAPTTSTATSTPISAFVGNQNKQLTKKHSIEKKLNWQHKSAMNRGMQAPTPTHPQKRYSSVQEKTLMSQFVNMKRQPSLMDFFYTDLQRIPQQQQQQPAASINKIISTRSTRSLTYTHHHRLHHKASHRI